LAARSASASPIRENIRAITATASASKATAIQRQSGVSSRTIFTRGSGKYFSTGRSLVASASLGISFTLSAENSQTSCPDRSLMRSIRSSTVWLPILNDATRSRSGESPSSWSPSGLRLNAATSKAGSRSRSWSNCCAVRGPSLTRWSWGIPRKFRYLAACAKFADRQNRRKESTALCGESRCRGSSATFAGGVAAAAGGGPGTPCAQATGPTDNIAKSKTRKAEDCRRKRFRRGLNLALEFPDAPDAKTLKARG